MNLTRILPLSTLALAVLGACSSLPDSNAQLDAAHSDYRVAQNDELVRQLAPAEMRRATEALTRADNAFERRDKGPEVDHLAYLARSQIAVAHATAAGAPELAPQEMRLAREKLERAQLAMGQRDYDTARMLARESQADAQLAESKTEAIKARKAADESQQAGRALREEMNRKAP